MLTSLTGQSTVSRHGAILWAPLSTFVLFQSRGGRLSMNTTESHSRMSPSRTRRPSCSGLSRPATPTRTVRAAWPQWTWSTTRTVTPPTVSAAGGARTSTGAQTGRTETDKTGWRTSATPSMSQVWTSALQIIVLRWVCSRFSISTNALNQFRQRESTGWMILVMRRWSTSHIPFLTRRTQCQVCTVGGELFFLTFHYRAPRQPWRHCCLRLHLYVSH